MQDISITVNDESHRCSVDDRTSLADLIRDELKLTGTRLGCEHGVCGACTVLIDDVPARSCIVLAAQVDGHAITTIEGVSGTDGTLSPVQEAFCDTHAVQCGYCTAGMVLAATHLLQTNAAPDDEAIDEAIGSNICRCTGYTQIREAIALAATRMSTHETSE